MSYGPGKGESQSCEREIIRGMCARALPILLARSSQQDPRYRVGRGSAAVPRVARVPSWRAG